MIKLIIKILLIPIIVGLIVSIVFWGFIIIKGDKEIVVLNNDNKGEKIYLIKQSWGFGDTKMAIGLNKRLGTVFNNSPKDKYIERVSTEFIFYKIDNGKLYIYNDNFEKPVKNRFQTEIIFIKLTNREFINLGENKNYEKKEISIFPESAKRRLNYADSLNDKSEK